MKLSDDQVRYVDRPDICETFSDSLGNFFFDGQTARLEFCVLRHDNPQPPKPPTAAKYPICRLILTPDNLIELYNVLHKIMAALEGQGIVKKSELPKGGPIKLH